MMRTRHVFFLFFTASAVAPAGCQAIAGIGELTLSPESGGGGTSGDGGGSGGANGSGGAGGDGGAPIPGEIQCGGVICPLGPKSACCHDQDGADAGPQDECVVGPPETDGCNTAAGVTGFEARIECQLPSHCPPGSFCCGARATAAGKEWYATVSCQPQCDYPFYEACDPSVSPDVCPLVNVNGAPTQLACKQSPILPAGSFMCQP